jgi:4-hydroxy-3-polyprenylbenzoate decarboxylase
MEDPIRSANAAVKFEEIDMAQESLAEFVEVLEKNGLLRRYKEEKRVDELPRLMEDNPDQAILVEKVKDSPFPFLANAYGSRAMYALSLKCRLTEVGSEIAERQNRHYEAELVESAPCKEVILKGDDVDLTLLPLLNHHPRDGQAYINDTRIITRDPATGLINDAIQRMMFRSKNMTNVDMRAWFHAGSIAGQHYHDMGKDMPIAVCIGGPTLDKIASMMRSPGARIDAWDRLGGFYGAPAKVVKCETNDLTVPANAEIVLEGRVLTSEGMIHDEGPYGEFPGTYGAGLPRNWAVVIDCITYRKDAIYQHATIGGLHPGKTDMYAFQQAIEGELFEKLQRAGLVVRDVVAPAEGGGNVAYARIKAIGGGDAMQALSVMLTGCRQYMPKIAYVFDVEVDIYDDARVKWAQAWRYNPEKGTLIVPRQNTMPLDPSLKQPKPPFSTTKIGFDCTIGVDAVQADFEACVVTEPIAQPIELKSLSEIDITAQMRHFIQEVPRTWQEILERFAGQPYPFVYRAFGSLRPQLGRMANASPNFPYIFSTTGNFVEGSE